MWEIEEQQLGDNSCASSQPESGEDGGGGGDDGGGCVVVGGQTEVEDGGVGDDHVAGDDRISYVGHGVAG